MPPLQQLQFPKSNGDDEDQENDQAIFMNQKSMANSDVFARLAALTNATVGNVDRGDPTLGSLTGSRMRTHSHGYGSWTARGDLDAPSMTGSGMSSTNTSSIPPSSPGSPGKRPRKRQKLDFGDR
jgi:hypothetical protein